MRNLAPPASIAGRSAPSLFFLPRIYDFGCSSLGIHHRSTSWSPWRHSWPHLRLQYRQETRDAVKKFNLTIRMGRSDTLSPPRGNMPSTPKFPMSQKWKVWPSGVQSRSSDYCNCHFGDEIKDQGGFPPDTSLQIWLILCTSSCSPYYAAPFFSLIVFVIVLIPLFLISFSFTLHYDMKEERQAYGRTLTLVWKNVAASYHLQLHK